MKSATSIIAILFAITAHAEWYYVTSVTDYNRISAHMVDGSTNSDRNVVIRIANLEKIEDIQDDRTKVMLGGAEPKQLAKEILLNQVVWVDQLKVENGENVANVYPSYDRILRTFTDRRIGGTHSVNPVVLQKIERVYTRMLAKFASETPDRNKKQTSRSNQKSGQRSSSKNGAGSAGQNPVKPSAQSPTRILGWYENEYSKALFIYDALDWFKHDGQYLPGRVQALYVDWLSEYLNATGSDALSLEVKILDMQQKSDLHRDFILDS